MREPAPSTIQRMLTLRQFPGFGDTELPDLAAVAESLVDRTFRAGTQIADVGDRAPMIQLIVDGRFEAPASGHAWGPHQLFGSLEALAGRPFDERIVAVRDTQTLQLTTSLFAELLEDNYDLLASTRRVLARRLLAFPPSLLAGPEGPFDRFLEPLGMVDRLLILRSAMPFASANIEALATLAQLTEEERFAAGSYVHRLGEETLGPMIILDGSVHIQQPTASHLMGGGSTIAALETLAELPHLANITAVTDVRVLSLPGTGLLDVMEDHTDFAIALLVRLAEMLLQLQRLPRTTN